MTSDIEKYDENMRLPDAVGGQRWYAPTEPPFRMVGLAWFDEDRIYRRMPLAPPRPLPESVDALAWKTAGGQVRFRTDAVSLSVRVKLRGPHGMDHMPATGECGLDCYLGEPGQARYCSTTRFSRGAIEYESPLFADFSREWRTVTLNMPLYQGLESLSIGLDAEASVTPPPDYDQPGRAVFYGTSITQGGCASRPGMAYTNILSRRFNVEFVNLGFSGSGRGEPSVAHAITTVPDPLFYVLDYEANAGLEGIQSTLRPFIEILRGSFPKVPIAVVSRPPVAKWLHDPSQREPNDQARAFMLSTVNALEAAGDPGITFVDGSLLMGADFDECTVDGGHPTDLGFYRMAEGLAPVVKRLLDMAG